MIIYQHAIFESEASWLPVSGSLTEDKDSLKPKVDMIHELGYSQAHIRTRTIEVGGWCR